MLKKRIIPVLLLKNGRMVKGKQFCNYRDTGEPKTAIRIYSAQDADELIFLNIDSQTTDKSSLIELLKIASKECFMPLSAGGGVDSVQDVRDFLLAGADKVVINTNSVLSPNLIKKSAEIFGSQCIVGSIDYKKSNIGSNKVYINSGKTMIDLDPISHAIHLESLGVGEIILNSIDRDGMMQGYDIELAEEISTKISIPLIVAGGAGNFMHLIDLFKNTDSSAAACASIFHFGDNNPIRARSYLKNAGIPMRVLR